MNYYFFLSILVNMLEIEKLLQYVFKVFLRLPLFIRGVIRLFVISSCKKHCYELLLKILILDTYPFIHKN